MMGISDAMGMKTSSRSLSDSSMPIPTDNKVLSYICHLHLRSITLPGAG